MIPLNNNYKFTDNKPKEENFSLIPTKSNTSYVKNNSQNTAGNAEPELHSNSGSKVDGIIEYIFIKFSNSVRLIGPLFAFCLVTFVIAVANTAFNFIIPYWMKNFHVIFAFLYLIALYLLFSILFNYFLAVLVKPGSLADIRNGKYYRKNDPLRITSQIINFENSKLAENLIDFYSEENKKNEASASSHIKIRYKTNENSIFNLNGNENSSGGGSCENYNKQDDLKTLVDFENSQIDNLQSESNYL